MTTQAQESDDFHIEERILLDKIWSAVRVGFCLLTHQDKQYVAYYDADRRMVVAMRDLGEDKFTKQFLPSRQGWDSHNYITMAVDRDGNLHLSGNMHANPLVYFRTQKPGDLSTMTRFNSMVGSNEKRCTYPKFMKGPDGRLLFHYRDGGSGNGNENYNVYDADTGTWRRFLDAPLLDGEGKMNAYQRGPQLGPDGWYHLAWMWRDTPDAATNHDISYARSRDLRHWENAAGQPLKLPLTIKSKGTIIDPVPPGGGLINSCFGYGFDSQNRLVVTYHKHDDAGDTQAYAARFHDGEWIVKAVSDWDGRHIFKGGGSGPSTYGTSLGLGNVKQHGEGKLALPFRHWKEGNGLLVFDEETLARVGVEPQPQRASRYPAALTKVQSEFPEMRVHLRPDSGDSPDTSSRYVLRWETLGSHRDRPREGALPENSELVLYRISQQEQKAE